MVPVQFGGPTTVPFNMSQFEGIPSPGKAVQLDERRTNTEPGAVATGGPVRDPQL